MVNLFPLNVRGAVARRRGRVLVGPVDLRLDGTGTTVLIGPNGSGKTTLLALLHGISRLGGGEIVWNCPVEDARARQAFVFQRPILLRRSVEGNLSYPLELRGVARPAARKTAAQWAGRMGLSHMLGRSAARLSGGEQQKLALARALVLRPSVLFLDEPCAALDGRSTRLIEDVLAEAKAAGTALILSTHDMGQARRLADDVVFLLHGKVHETGPAQQFFAAPQTAAASAFLNGDIVE